MNENIGIDKKYQTYFNDTSKNFNENRFIF